MKVALNDTTNITFTGRGETAATNTTTEVVTFPSDKTDGEAGIEIEGLPQISIEPTRWLLSYRPCECK